MVTPEDEKRRDSSLVNVIDVEATCWDKQDLANISDIIEIGISVLDTESFEIVSTESIIVKPKHSTVSEFCTQLTTLTPQYVEEHGVSFEAAAALLVEKYCSKDRLFASWGNYDRKIFRNQFELYGMESSFGKQHLNIKTLFAKCLNLDREVGMDGALKRVDIPLEGTHHRGGDDSRNIAKLLAYILSRRTTDEHFAAMIARYGEGEELEKSDKERRAAGAQKSKARR